MYYTNKAEVGEIILTHLIVQMVRVKGDKQILVLWVSNYIGLNHNYSKTSMFWLV